MNTLYQEIGKRIADLRHNQKMTQEQLAEQLDISIKHCSEVERGLSCLSLEKMIKLCTILSTDMDYLTRGIDWQKVYKSEIPAYVMELFLKADDSQSELLQEYLVMFKKLSAQKK